MKLYEAYDMIHQNQDFIRNDNDYIMLSMMLGFADQLSTELRKKYMGMISNDADTVSKEGKKFLDIEIKTETVLG